MAAIDWGAAQQMLSSGKTTAEVASHFNMQPHVFRARRSEYLRKAQAQQALEDFIRLAQQTQDVLATVDPIITSEHVGIFTESVAVMFISCLHLGSRYTDYEKLADLVKFLRQNSVYVVILGDDVDGYEGFSDVATSSEQALASPLLQRRFLESFIDVVGSNRFLAAYAGQHGAQWQRKNTGVDPLKQIYLERGIPYFDGQGFIELTVGSERYKIFGAHKLSGRSKTHPLSAQLSHAKGLGRDADMIVMGDSHQFSVMDYSPNSFSTTSRQWLVQVGTLKTGNDPYTIRSWSNGQFGYPAFIFSSKQHRIIYLDDVSHAAWMLDKV